MHCNRHPFPAHLIQACMPVNYGAAFDCRLQSHARTTHNNCSHEHPLTFTACTRLPGSYHHSAKQVTRLMVDEPHERSAHTHDHWLINTTAGFTYVKTAWCLKRSTAVRRYHITPTTYKAPTLRCVTTCSRVVRTQASCKMQHQKATVWPACAATRRPKEVSPSSEV